MTYIFMTRCALVLALLAPLGTAEAGSKRIGAASTGQELPASQMAPLTAGECKRLGGTVSTDKNCKTGKDCTTFVLGGSTHSVCIDEVEN